MGWESGDDDERIRWARFDLDPNELGRVFGKLAAGFWIVAILSLLVTVGMLLNAADEPFVDQPHVEDPISGWAFVLSLTGAGLSLLAYVVWSVWMLRWRRATGESDEDRVERTLFALVCAIISLGLPVDMTLHFLTS